LLGDKLEKIEVIDRHGKQFKLTDARWKRFSRLLKQYEGWASALRAAHGHGIVAFLQEGQLLEAGITDAEGLLAHIGRDPQNGAPYRTELLVEDETELVVRTIEAKSGLASTHHVRRAALEATEYQHLAHVHADLDALAGSPPFQVKLGDQASEAASFEALRATVLGVAQKGVDYVRFKGLGEMDADELRDTTMDPASRTLVQVTMEDAASADHVFSMLMGDQVEPRRAFIEENARLVTNLDV